ncbi:MAG: hypothetical protein K6T26_03350 [Alicyclobacillus sp.]|nr:hypothetical protein [Alicyclobacillus sp.]
MSWRTTWQCPRSGQSALVSSWLGPAGRPASAPDLRTQRRDIVLLWVVNALLRGVWLWFMHPPQYADFAWYYARASELAAGQGYVWNGHPTAYWPIGWPLFLSLVFRLTGPHMVAAWCTTAGLSLVLVSLVYLLAVRAGLSRNTACTAAYAYTFLPSQVLWNSVFGSEELFTVLLLWAIWLYLPLCVQAPAPAENRRAGLAGWVLGLACLVRPLPLLFPGAVLLLERWRLGRSWRTALAHSASLAAGMAVAILPLTVRNRLQLGHWVLVSTNGGVNLWQGTWIDGGYFWSWNPDINPLLAAHGDEIVQNALGMQAAWRFISAHPLIWLYHGLWKVFDLYKDDTNAVWYTFHMVAQSGGVVWAWNLICTYAYYVFMALAVAGMLVLRRQPSLQRRARSLLVAFVVYYSALFLAFPAWDRFRYPLMPLFALYTGSGLQALGRRLKRFSMQLRRHPRQPDLH